jgi:ABC-type Fe3+/spermidine/putrescine transport system ATPase subunit
MNLFSQICEMDLLQVKDIAKKDERGFALQDISFSQSAGQHIAIAGETGSGKTTLLKIIAGLAQPDKGEVRFEGEKVIGPADKLIPGHKGIAYLSQHFELPHFLRVEQVLEYANEWSVEKADKLFQLCQITHLFKRRTDQLSGGERQRIAIARLLITGPRLFLLDEPFSNTDLAHKTILKEVVGDLSRELNISFMLVSHDPVDTLDWADRIFVMRAGRFIEEGTPFSIYKTPATVYTAGLFGKYNILEGQPGNFRAGSASGRHEGTRWIVRPENCFIYNSAAANTNTNTNEATSSATGCLEIQGTISSQRFYGHYYETDVFLQGQTVITRSTEQTGAPGDEVVVRIQTGDVHRASDS